MAKIAEKLGYTEQELNYLYNSGANKCQIGDFKGALAIFQFLYMLDTQNLVFSKAIAGCMHALEEYDAAISYYKTTYEGLMERCNYDCLFYIARCYFKLNDNSRAVSNLNKFLELCAADKIAEDSYDKLIKKAKILLKSTHADSKANAEVK